MSFMENYEDVNARLIRYWQEFPNGRLFVEIEQIDIEKGIVLARGEAYRNIEDAVPAAVDFAIGIRDTYPANMRKWFVEDTITSCYGRVIGALTPPKGQGAKRPTAQDMAKVERVAAKDIDVNEPNVWTGWAEPAAEEEQPTGPAPTCAHGEMRRKGGFSPSGKKLPRFECPSPDRADQCKAVW